MTGSKPLQKYFEGNMQPKKEEILVCVIHQVGIEVLRDGRYVRWMREFGSHMEVIAASQCLRPFFSFSSLC